MAHKHDAEMALVLHHLLHALLHVLPRLAIQGCDSVQGPARGNG